MPVKVYRYGLLRPTENADLVSRQMRAAHIYRNTLTEIERGRRTALRSAMPDFGNIRALELEAANAKAVEIDAVKVIRSQRSKTRDRSDTTEMRARVRAAREQRKLAVRKLREARKEAREDVNLIAKTDEINDRAAELRRSAREFCGVYWGTYLLVEDAEQAARKSPLYDGAEPNDPRFARFSGEGNVGVQIQGGAPAESIVGGFGTLVRIDSVNENAWHAENRCDRRRASRTTLRIRVGSDDARSPIWAAWPMIMHRPFPDGAVIKRATVSKRMIGPREEWSVTFTVVTEDTQASRCPTNRDSSSIVAIDLGWRTREDGLRVAYWRDGAGEHGEFVVPNAVLGALRKSEDLRSIRDTNFNVARSALNDWMRARPIPEWLVLDTKTLPAWRSAARLAYLARKWKSNRFDGDVIAYEALEKWRYHDYHLWEWETSQRRKSLRRRREVYRCFAADLAKRYETIVLEGELDLRAFAIRQTADADAENETARSNRQLVAVSELRLAMVNAFGAERVAFVPAKGTSETCYSCLTIDVWEDPSALDHACSGCGLRWDRDDNATRNLLRRYRESRSVEKDAVGSRMAEKENENNEVVETRWVRAKRLRAEKEERKQSAREAVANIAE
jgi:hypothetical protein